MGFPNVGLELCRLCALEKDNLLGIYDSDGLRLTLNAKIKKCLNIEVSEKENYPKSICLDCCSKLDAFNEFLDSSINAQATLSILYADKVGRITEINYSDLEDASKTDEEDAFMLGDVPPHVEMDIGKTEFVGTEKPSFIPDSSTQDLVGCSEPAGVEAQEILQNVDCDFIGEKSNEYDPLGEGSDSDARGNKNSEDWSNTSNWLCTDCSEQFNNVEDLRAHHRAEHNQDARYMCEFCSKLFIDHTLFLSHLKRHKKTLKYSCGMCDKVFSNKKVCNAHKLAHSDLKPAFVCSACGKSFKQQSSLFYHSRCHLPEEKKFKHPCDFCKKRFSTRPNLVTHMRIHTGVRNFTCDQCGKSFIQKGNLEAHLLTHSNDKPYECVVCNRKFKTGMQLRKHHSVHTGAKPHQCDVCGRTFREKGTLREHHRIHTGAMPFACEYCGKTFRFKGILTTHRRQHTGERPYSCFECQHHFTNWPNYNKHMKRRHGINTSRSARPAPKETADDPAPLQAPAPQEVPAAPPVQQTQEPLPDPTPQPQIYQEIQPADLYANMSSAGLAQASPNALPTYMAYNVYSLSHVTTMDGTTIELLPRQTISLKEASSTSGAINF